MNWPTCNYDVGILAVCWVRPSSYYFSVINLVGPIFAMDDSGNLIVTCMATGYPGPVTASLDNPSNHIESSTTPGGTRFALMRTLVYMFADCVTNTTYMCSATSGRGMRIANDGMPTGCSES